MPRIEIKSTKAQMNNFLRDLQEVLDKHGAVVSFDCAEYEDPFSAGHRFTVQFNMGVEDGNRYPTYTDEANIINGNIMSSRYRVFKVGE